MRPDRYLLRSCKEYLQAEDISVGRLSGGEGVDGDVGRDGVEAAGGGAPVGAEGGGLRRLHVAADGAVPRLAHQLAPVEGT